VNALPTERDLPPAARDALRARAVDAVRHPARPPRRWVPLAAAAALAAVVAGSVVAVALTDRDSGPAAGPPSATPVTPGPTARSASPSPTPIDLSGPPRFVSLGMTRIAVDSRLQGLVNSACGFHGAKVRLAVTMRYSTMAIVAPGADAFGCGLAADGGPGLGGAGSYTPQLPSSPMVAPVRTDGLAEQAVAEGLFLSTLQGKVTSDVRRVTLTYDGHVLDATVGNGVYVGGALIQYGPSRPLPRTPDRSTPHGLPNPPAEPTVRAYDANGTLLYQWDRAEVDATGRGDVSCAKGPGNCRYPWP
jgi:hypothetical protein